MSPAPLLPAPRKVFRLLLATLSGLSLALPAAAEPRADVTVIPVVVNIFPGSGATEERAKEAVAEANKIFAAAEAGLKLAVVQVNVLTAEQAKTAGDDGTSSGEDEGVAADGIFTGAEGKKVIEYGKKEVAKLAGKKGIKYCFAKQPTAFLPTNPGASGDHPVILVMDQGAGAANIRKTASTMAHELGHVLGLRAGHKIRGEIVADEGGHAPEETNDATGKGNLMARFRIRTGTALQPDQVKVIKENARKYGWCTAQFQEHFPGVKLSQGFGRDVDGALVAVAAAADSPGAGPGAPDLLAIDDVTLSYTAPLGYGMPGMPVIEGEIRVAGVAQPGEPVDARYTLGFDADGNPGTGVFHAGAPGVDRIVEVIVQGAAGPGLHRAAWVRDAPSGYLLASLPPPEVTVDLQLPQDYDVFSPGLAVPLGTILRLDLPPYLLGLSAPQVTVVASAGNGVASWHTAPFVYDQAASAGRPTLQTYGDGVPTPGAPYPFSVQGLAPGAAFMLYLDEEPVLSGLLDGAGSFQGEIAFPVDVPTGVAHVLVAQDETGEIASGMTCPEYADVRLPEGSIAQGGAVVLTLEGVTLAVATHPGEPAPQVIYALAQAIWQSPELAAKRVTAQPMGHRLETNGEVTAWTVHDPGLMAGAAAPVLVLR